ncbi:hypothetical protein CHS0354_017550 [Potamilus streckersoni]|uniref:ADF-H domain-containing protein n=1 Tax=Potamilus streckersoni TaxID=2493646 RepID=A0AAE0TFY7_9BIVA|nr:hypothetical protein CHS0354_017550 [Potamilus streckersoni]
MAENLTVCDISDNVKQKMKKLRFRKEKNIAALLLNINKDSMQVVLEQEYEDCSIEELQQELPDHQPRFLIISYVYEHDDGRVSYPLCFVYCIPSGCKPEQRMMFAGSLQSVQQEMNMTKTFEIRSPEELTEEWLKEKLKFFR